MRIGVDVRELEAGKRTGIGRYLTNLLESATFRASRHTWVLFGNQRSTVPEGLAMVRIPERSRLWWDDVALPQALKRHAIQLFFSPYRKAPLWLPCPSVITIHDFYPFSLPGRPVVRDLPFWIFMRRVAQQALRIITVSQFVKQEIVTWLRVAAEKVVVVYHGVGPSFRPIDPCQARAPRVSQVGVEDEHLLFVGQLKPHKNVHRLIQAYGQLSRGLRDRCPLVIVGGDGVYRTTLEALVTRAHLAERVRLLGVVEDAMLPLCYSQAAALVLPSSYEGFGLPAIEAMACGCPVVAAKRTALPEVVGEAALLMNPDDPAEFVHVLTQVLTDEALRATLRQKGLARARQFSLETFVEHLLGVFDEIEQELLSSCVCSGVR